MKRKKIIKVFKDSIVAMNKDDLVKMKDFLDYGMIQHCVYSIWIIDLGPNEDLIAQLFSKYQDIS